MDVLQDCLYRIATALLLPTIVVLLGFLAWTIVLAGGLVRECFERRRIRKALNAALETMNGSPGARDAAFRKLKESGVGLPARFCGSHADWPHEEIDRAKRIEDLESEVTASMARLTFITRIGPMLGLMGTLIPLGPALTGLATGNIQALSGNLVVAFTTTVVGVLIGGCSFGMALVRRTWYNRDLSDLEYLSRKALPEEAIHVAR